MTLLAIALIASAVVALAGIIAWYRRPSFSLYRVRKGDETDAGDPHGIPFYVKRGQLVQETSYIQHLVAVRLEAWWRPATVAGGNAEAAGGVRHPLGAQTVVVAWPEHADQIRALETALADVTSPTSTDVLEKWAEAQRAFSALPTYRGTDLNSVPVTLERNEVKQEAYVDYGEVYYINTEQARSGVTEAAVELATDGTLSKATVKRDDKELEQLSSLLPVEKLVDKAMTVPTEGPLALRASGSLDRIRIEVSLEKTMLDVRHTLSKVYPPAAKVGPQPRASIELASRKDENVGYRREVITHTPPEPKPKARKTSIVGARAQAGLAAGLVALDEALALGASGGERIEDEYEIVDGSDISVSVVIGDGKTGGIVVGLDGSEIGSGAEIDDLHVGEGSAIRGSRLVVVSTAVDLGSGSSRASATVTLVGGNPSEDEWEHQGEVDPGGSVTFTTIIDFV